MNLSETLQLFLDKKASDLHLSTDNPIMMRVDGELEVVGDYIIQESDCLQIFNDEEIAAIQGIDPITFNKERDLDFAVNKVGGRFRVNAFHQNGKPAMVFRTIPSKVLSLDDLKLSPFIKKSFLKMCEAKKGLVLVTGPTGSGKSTTLAALIDHLNQTRKEHILTIEDPIEFVHQRKNCLINQREVGRDSVSFEKALRAALREDPDIILIGEMRDLETIRLALSAAETGHLVFGTLHTTSAAKTVDRVIDVFPPAEKDMIRTMLSESLNAVISQTLIRKEGGGRVAAHEIMVCNSAIKNLIRENKVAQMYSTIQTGSAEGMITLDQSLRSLLTERKIKLEDARVLAKEPKEFV